MFHQERRTVPDSPGELFDEYAADLAAATEDVGVDRAVERTGLERGTIESVSNGDLSELTLSEAAAIQALVEGTPDPETIVEIGCDHLLLGMSTAVLDVDTVATDVDLELDPKEVQQKLERRTPMTFEEYVRLQQFIVDRQP